MALTATISLSASTVTINVPIIATLTISNSGAAAINLSSVLPQALNTANTLQSVSAALGSVYLGPGTVISVPPSGSLIFEFAATFFSPSTGALGNGSNTYSIGANCIGADGSLFSPTAALLTVNPLLAAGQVSYVNSVVTASASTVVSGASVLLTLTTKDVNNNPLSSGGQTVVFTNNAAGTSTGTISATTDNGNGTYNATYTGVLAGTADGLGATINGRAISSTLPTVAVTPGAVSLSQSVVTRASATVVSGATDLCTLTAKDAAGNQLPTGGLTVLFSTTGGASTGTFGATSDVGDGTYTALFTGVLVGAATSIASTIGGLAVTSTKPTITVTVGAAAKALWLVQPSNAVHGVNISPSMTVRITDAAGNTRTADTTNIVLTIGTNPAAGTLSGTTTRAAVAGISTFNDIQIDNAGTGYTLVATPTALTLATSTAFNIT